MDKIEICNMALSRIGIENIESLTEASEPARACAQFYDHARRVVLRRYPWTWSTRRVTLAMLSGHPPDYEYAYRYPADCVTIRRLYNEKYDNSPSYTSYRIAGDESGRILYTDVPGAVCEYTADVTDCSLMDDQFVEALSWKLAADVAFKLTGSAQNVQMAEQQYQTLFLDAVANNEDEQNTKEEAPDAFIRARFEEV